MIREKLSLGTVQLGLDYGVANRTGKPSSEMAMELLETAWSLGIRTFDTASNYGDSESILGSFLRSKEESQARITSKLRLGGLDDPGELEPALGEILNRLGVGALDALLLHGFDDLENYCQIADETIRRLKVGGRIEDFGVSVYTPEQAFDALTFEGVTALQIPCNVFDNRWRKTGFVEMVEEKKIKVDLRSVYLQGVALMDPQDVPSMVPGGREAVTRLDNFCREHGIPRDSFCLGWGLFVFPGARLVIGSESTGQVERNVAALSEAASMDEILLEAWEKELPEYEESLLNPSRWK